ncbi:Ig-like domain-containing protein, partial [Aurantivibrio plasticivorans]
TSLTIEVEASDGTNTASDSDTSTVIRINDAPILDLDANNSTATGSDFVTSFTEGGSPAFIADVDIAISDVDDTQIESATITVQSVEAGDLLIVGSLPSGISASAYNPTTGEITLIGSASLADYQTAIRAIQYTNDGSSTAATRDVSVIVNDGDADSNVATTTINVTTIPTVSITDVAVQEPSSGTTTLVFTVSVDELLASDLTFDYDTADISALAGADYVGVSGGSATILANSSSTTISITINSDANNFEGDETFSVDLSNFNQTVNYDASAHVTTDGIQGIGTIDANNGAPVATDDSFATTPNTAFTTGNVLSNDQLIDNATISSVDTTGVSGTVVNNGDGTFDYTPASGFVGTETFTYTLTDLDGETSTATVSIEVTNSLVVGPDVINVPNTSYTENDSAVQLLSGVSITDADSTSLSSVVVELSGYIPSQDVLSYLTSGTSVNASAATDGNTWSLTLTGGADINEYLAVLNSISYENSSENPSTAGRTVTVTAYDQDYNNVFASDAGTLSVVAVNDAPVTTDNDVFTIQSSNDNGLNITAPTDFDNDDSTLVITVTGLPTGIGSVMMADGVTPVTNGQVLTLAELTSLVFDAGSTQGTDDFTYTVSDGDITTVGTTTIDVGTTNADVNTVYEGGLSGGTSSGSALATGNLLDNDAIPTSAIDSIDFNGTTYSEVGGIITVDTPLGVLTVYADNSNGRATGDYDYQLEATDGSGNDVTEQFTYQITSGSLTYTDNLTISIIDDMPIANNLSEDIPESEEQVFNLVFTLDVSTSMNATVGTTGQSRLELAKEALVALADEYFNQSTQVNLTVVLFADGAHELGTYSDFASAEAAITAITDNTQTAYGNDVGSGNLTNSTSYNDALNLIENVFQDDLSTQSPADDVQNISYFLSDGAITADGTPIGNGFDTFVNANSIDSYSVGIGTGLPSDLSDLNFIHNIDSLGAGNGTIDDALIISDVSLLESELLSTVPTAFGGNITFNGSIPNILFGADGGYVESISLVLDSGTETFTFNGTSISGPAGIGTLNGSQLTLSSSQPGDGFGFGTFTFDFADGTYLFSAPNGSAPATFDFDYSVLDSDGDSASATATINIVDDKPDARDDLDTYQYVGQVVEGNVINGLDTDGGPRFGTGFTPFASQGGGIDKIVDDATVTEFSFRGISIDLDLPISLAPPASGGSDSVLVNSQADINASDFSITSSVGVLGFDNAGGGQGLGVNDGSGNADEIDSDEQITITWDSSVLPYGVSNLVLTTSGLGGSEDAIISVFDVNGVEMNGSPITASGGTIDLSTFDNVGSITMGAAVGDDYTLATVSYDPAPEPYVTTPASGSDGTLSWVYSVEEDIDGNIIVQATVTDSSDGSILVMRSNGYYQYIPDPANAPVEESVAFTSAGNVFASDLTLSGFNSGGGTASLNYSVDGVTIQGGANNDRIDDGERLSIDFTSGGGNPFGVQNIQFGYTSMSGGETVTYTIYALDGVTVLGTENSDSTPFVLSAADYPQIGRVDITADNGSWVRLQTITYDELQSAPVTNVDPVFVDYTLTDSDGQSDTARLSIYSIDNEITGTAGVDNILGSSDNDAIIGDAGNDTLSGGDGHDNISGGEGLDILVGGLGDDYLSGGTGADDLQGGLGQDHLAGDEGDDLLDGGQGDDVALGGDGNDQVFGGAGDDRLEGNEGDDQLFGGAGNDQLEGGDGDDTLLGGQGDDQLLGGLGVDVFKWSFADNGSEGSPAVDTILDFNSQPASAGGDVLDLRDLLVGESEASLDEFLYFEQQGANTVISISTEGGFGGGFDSNAVDQQIVIEGVDLVTGFADQSALIQDLINNGKLITD